jgi:hypothetical protein
MARRAGRESCTSEQCGIAIEIGAVGGLGA